MKISLSPIAAFAVPLLISITSLPVYATSQENFSSKLINHSKQQGADGYYLIQDKVLGENDCVKIEGNKKIQPGETAQLHIKKECTWGVVRYKILSIKDNKELGHLGHSFHDGKFSIDITSLCKGSECTFYDLNPEQNRNNK